jgi:hypothetical protein
MQSPSTLRAAQDQATGAILIIRIVFDYFAAQDGFADFINRYESPGHLTDSMFGKNEVSLTGDLLNGLDVHSQYASIPGLLSVRLFSAMRSVYNDRRTLASESMPSSRLRHDLFRHL